MVRRNRRLDIAVAALAIGLLAISYAPWWREIGLQSHTTNAWHRSTTWVVTIAVVLGAAGLWLVRTDRRARAAAAAGAVAAAGWFLGYTWLSPAVATRNVTDTTIVGQSVASGTRFAGLSYGPYLGSLVIVPIVSIMVVAMAVDLARNRPRPRDWRRLARIVPILAALALLAVSLAPWWHHDSQTANVWFSSTVWAAAIVVTGLALGVWWWAERGWARIAAVVLAVGSAVLVVGYTLNLQEGAKGKDYYVYTSVVSVGEFVDYHPAVPSLIHRDQLVAYPDTSGLEIGAYLGVGLIVVIAVVMVLVTFGPAVARRARRRGGAR